MPGKTKSQIAPEIAAAEANAPTEAHAEMARDAILAEAAPEIDEPTLTTAPMSEIDPNDVADVIAEIEIAETVAEVQTPVQEPHTPDLTLTFDDIVGGLPMETIDRVRNAIHHALLEREAFEEAKNPDNASIHRTLKKVRSQLVRDPAAKVMAAANVDPGFTNRGLRSGACYNVYAIGKLADIVWWVNHQGRTEMNAINNAIVRTLMAFSSSDSLVFTLETAKACCSKNYPYYGDGLGRMTRHTVAPRTAPTQASSTMQALETLGVVKSSGGSGPNRVYQLLDTPFATKLKELVLAAA